MARWKRSDWFALASLVVSVIAIGVTVAPPVYQRLTATRASITVPTDHFMTKQARLDVSGEVRNRPDDATKDIWLVVRPQVANRWYPVTRLQLQAGDQWQAPDVILGGPGHYQLYLFMTDSGASAEFGQWALNNQANPDPPGMIKPPIGADYLSAIDVERLAE